MDFSGKNILVVGASGVLGANFVEALSQAGANLYGTATSAESAQRIPASANLKLLLDLTSDESITTLANYLNAEVPLDGVILSAGVVGFGPATEASHDQVERMNRINYLGQVRLLNLLKDNLAGREQAFVLSVTGIVAQTPLPNMSHYSSSKAALHGFLTAVTREWRRDGVQVVSSVLGHTETGLASRPLFGTAPAFPAGLDPKAAAAELLATIN